MPPPQRLIAIGENLCDKTFKDDVQAVFEYARGEHGVSNMVLTTSDLRASLEQNLRLCRAPWAGKALTCTVGLHPHKAREFKGPSTLAEMRRIVSNNKGVVVAIGETGLDFNRDFSPREKQVESFAAHVALAQELRLPLFLHERDAHVEFLRVLDGFDPSRCHAVVHCFTGTRDELREYLRRGLYVGLTGTVAMAKRGLGLRDMLAAGELPLERLMVETDCPYMTPDGAHDLLMRSGRNEPATLSVTVRTIADALGVSYEKVARATTENAIRFFGLDASVR